MPADMKTKQVEIPKRLEADEGLMYHSRGPVVLPQKEGLKYGRVVSSGVSWNRRTWNKANKHALRAPKDCLMLITEVWFYKKE